ncbi:MAG: hypothetical protein ACLPQ0_10750 [Candidatus Binatus sp.]
MPREVRLEQPRIDAEFESTLRSSRFPSRRCWSRLWSAVLLAQSDPFQLRPKRRALEALRFEERFHEVAILEYEIRERALLPRKLLRIFQRALEKEPRDRVDVDCGDFASEPHRFERNSAAASEGIEHARGAPAVGFANLVAEILEVGVGFASPMQDAADGLLALDVNRFARNLFLLDLGNDSPADAFD